jgi:ribosome-binding factor A
MLALSPPPLALRLFAMSSRRVLKAAEAIREVVSMAILTELRDPRIEGVTVTHVEVSPDMRQAKVHVSIMGDDAQQRLCLHGLRSSAGFLQSKISDRIDTRYTPRLRFEIDEGVKKSLAISQLLAELLPNESETSDDSATSANDPVENEE